MQLGSDAEAVGIYVFNAGMVRARNSTLPKPHAAIRGRLGKALTGRSDNETQPPLTAIYSETQTCERGFFYRCAIPGNRGSARAERTRFGRVRRLRKQLADMC